MSATKGRALVVMGTIVLVSSMGCRTPEATDPTLPFTAKVIHFAGTPLSGPTDRPLTEEEPEVVPAVRVRAVALDGIPSEVGVALGSRARLVFSEGAESPLRASTFLSRGVRIADGPEAVEAWQDLSTDRAQTSMAGVLPSGVTASFELADNPALGDAALGKRSERWVVVQLAAQSTQEAARALMVALTVGYLEATPAAQTAEHHNSETAVFDVDAPPPGADILLLVPFCLSGLTPRAVAVSVRVIDGTTQPAHRAAVERALTEAADSRHDMEGAHRFGPAGPQEITSLGTAVALVASPGHRRAALVYIANQTNAAMTRDIALTADEELLGQLAEAVQAAMHAGMDDGGDSGWPVERATIKVLLELSAADELPSGAKAVLAAHYGEAGRHTTTLEELARQMASRQQFEGRVITENLVFLRDNAPGSRVRAFEWLSARELAPEGYDPLAPASERRVALDRAESVVETTAAPEDSND